MARGDKPYRVYRGGRTKGRVPTLPRPERGPEQDGRAGRPTGVPGPRRRRLGWGRRIALGFAVLVLLVVAWGVASYLSVRNGVNAANDRLENEARAVLAPRDGLLLSHPTTILLLGTDHAPTDARAGARRSDSIMLVRTEPKFNRIGYLSIPRDLLVDVPGLGQTRINAAYQVGGAALAIRAVRAFTGVPVEHVAVVDFSRFEELVDALGGVTVDVPAPILSNRFDCPYATPAQCRRWDGWRFRKGEQELDGRRALVYSRIRENRLDPSETDITRGERQQAVLQAITSKLTSPGVLARLPFLGDDVTAPLTTDLTSWEFLQLGWRKFRASEPSTLRCRLGGDAETVNGQSILRSGEENRNVIAMFLGVSAPQPPPRGAGPFAPGCIVGGR
jgi:LCP family protein required for cell wall assembly